MKDALAMKTHHRLACWTGRTVGHRVIALLIAVYCLAGPEAFAGPLSPFEGSWRGSGELVLDDGKTERVRCRINVDASLGGRRVSQLIRCASTGRDVEIESRLDWKDGGVIGTWRRHGTGESGSLAGRIEGEAINLRMTGVDVDAELTTRRISENDQQLVATGHIGPIRRLDVELKRQGQ